MDFCYTKKKKVFENTLALVGVVSTSFPGSTLSLARGVEKELGTRLELFAMQAEPAICSMAALINILSAEYPGNKINLSNLISFFETRNLTLGTISKIVFE